MVNFPFTVLRPLEEMMLSFTGCSKFELTGTYFPVSSTACTPITVSALFDAALTNAAALFLSNVILVLILVTFHHPHFIVMQPLIVIQRLHNLYPVHHAVKLDEIIGLKLHPRESLFLQSQNSVATS